MVESIVEEVDQEQDEMCFVSLGILYAYVELDLAPETPILLPPLPNNRGLL